jgi:hypothetical protein
MTDHFIPEMICYLAFGSMDGLPRGLDAKEKACGDISMVRETSQSTTHDKL